MSPPTEVAGSTTTHSSATVSISSTSTLLVVLLVLVPLVLHVQVCAYGTILYAAGPGNRNLRFCARSAYLFLKQGHMHGYSSQTQLKKDPVIFEVFKVFESVQCMGPTKHQSSSKRENWIHVGTGRNKHFKLHLSLNELILTVQVSLHLNSIEFSRHRSLRPELLPVLRFYKFRCNSGGFYTQELHRNQKNP